MEWFKEAIDNFEDFDVPDFKPILCNFGDDDTPGYKRTQFNR